MISSLLTLAARLRAPASSLKSLLRLGSSGALVLGLGLGSAQAQFAPAGTVATPARATASAPARVEAVGIVLTQAKVVKSADGKEQLVDAPGVKPGDVLEYRAVYTNRTDKAVTGAMATLPIPEGLVYQPRSARPVSSAGVTLQAATKDGVFAAEPLMRQVKGKAEPVPYAEYRALRWNLGSLGAKAQATVSARAAVEVFVPVVVPVTPGVAAGAAGGAQAPPAAARTTTTPR